MWLGSRIGVFTYFCIFLAKEFGNRLSERKNEEALKKNKEKMKKLKEKVKSFDNDRGNN